MTRSDIIMTTRKGSSPCGQGRRFRLAIGNSVLRACVACLALCGGCTSTPDATNQGRIFSSQLSPDARRRIHDLGLIRPTNPSPPISVVDGTWGGLGGALGGAASVLVGGVVDAVSTGSKTERLLRVFDPVPIDMAVELTEALGNGLREAGFEVGIIESGPRKAGELVDLEKYASLGPGHDAVLDVAILAQDLSKAPMFFKTPEGRRYVPRMIAEVQLAIPGATNALFRWAYINLDVRPGRWLPELDRLDPRHCFDGVGGSAQRP